MTLNLPQNLKDLPPVRELISQYGLKPDKKLGQNFLFDLGITDQIVLSAGNLEGKTVLEIGPGPGALTRSILASQAKRIIAVETDERCIRALRQMEMLSEGRLAVIHEDAMKLNLSTLSNEKLFVISNLPYNIGTILLYNWLEDTERFLGFVLMLQKEVVQRICARPSSPGYGKLSILAQIKAKTDVVFDVDPEFFFPPPKVTSSIVRILPYEKPPHEYEIMRLKKILNAAFGKRRKMVRTSLAPVFEDLQKVLSELNIEPTARAEDLTVEQFCALSVYEQK